MKRRLLLLLLSCLLVVLPSCSSTQAVPNTPTTVGVTTAGSTVGETSQSVVNVPPYKLAYALISATGTTSYNNGIEFIRLVGELSGGAITIEFFPDSVLGTETANQADLLSGALDMAALASSVSSVVKECGLFDLPYMITDRAQMKTLEDAGVLDVIREKAAEQGLIILSFSENGFRHITNGTKPINVPADLKDLKIRTPNNTLRMKTFQSLGANPSPVALGELYQALSQGVVQGQENTINQTYGNRFYEVQKYFSKSYHIYSPGFLIMSKITWDKLTKEQQDIMMEAGRINGDYARASMAEADDKQLKLMEESGVEVNEVDIEAFRIAMMPLWDEFAEEIGVDLVNMAKKALGY